MSELAERSNVESQSAARLLERWRSKANFLKLQQSYAAEAQELEDAAWQARLSRVLDSATKAQLDTLGAIVGESRDGRSDALYRLWIRVRIAINNSFGEAEDIMGALDLATSLDFHFRDLGIGAFKIDFDDKWDGFVVDLARIVDQTRAGGVSATVVWPTAASGIASALTAKRRGSATVAALALSSVATDTGGLASYRWRNGYPINKPILSSDDPFGSGGSGLLGFGAIDEGSLGES